jgi:hypothetical protein
MEHWSEKFEHEAITDDNREAFTKTASKFATQDDMAVGYMELQKTAGKPFKLPASMDKLPDDATRGELTSKVHELLGIAIPKDDKDLEDVDFKAGLAEEAVVNEELVGIIKKWAVETGVDKGSLAKMIGLYNGPLAEYAEQARTQAMNAKIEAAKTCNTAVIAHPDIGSDEKLKEQSILMERAILNNFGLTADEAEQFAKDRLGSITDTNPIMKRIMLTMLAPLAAESSVEGPGGGQNPAQAKDPDEGSPTYKALGWNK